MRKVYFVRNQENRERENKVKEGDIVRISNEYIFNTPFEKKSMKTCWIFTLCKIVGDKNENHSYNVEIFNGVDRRDNQRRVKNLSRYDIMERYLLPIDYKKFKKYNIVGEEEIVEVSEEEVETPISSRDVVGGRTRQEIQSR